MAAVSGYLKSLFGSFKNIEAIQQSIHLSSLKQIINSVYAVKLIKIERERVTLTLQLLQTACYCSNREESQDIEYIYDWVVSLGDFYNNPSFTCREELGEFLVASMRFLGIRKFLEALPLNISFDT